jgi:hypothetical protein
MKTKLILLMVLWTGSVVACKTTDSHALRAAGDEAGIFREAQTSDKRLDGAWQSRCLGPNKGLYKRTILTFTTPTVTLSNRYFSDKTCAHAAGESELATAGVNKDATVKGSFLIHKTDANELTELDLHLQRTKAFIVAKIDERQATFGKICKKDDVKKKACSKLSGQSAAERTRDLDPLSTYEKM